MATLTVLAWIAAFSLMVAVMLSYLDDEKASSTVAFLLLCSVIASFALGEAITYDMQGRTVNILNGPLKFYFLWGILTLATTSLTVAGLHRTMENRCGRFYYGNRPIDRISVFAVTGFVSSVLGIVSFYLEHIVGKG
jgi:hypothetical protein